MEEFTRCSVCDRTPLVGEGVTVRERGRREALVCDLCADNPRALALGEPVRRERIRSAAGAANVERVFPRPVVPVPEQPPAPVS
jgi:hypothetical protein